MSIPTNKQELLQAVTANYGKLKKELEALPHALTDIKELEGHRKGTLMSVNNLLAYLIGWGELVLKWNSKKDRNEPVYFPETGYKWNELGRLAQKFYADYEARDFNSLTQKLDATVTAVTALIESKSNAALYETGWYEKWTLGRMIQFNTSSPYANAVARLRKWKKQRLAS